MRHTLGVAGVVFLLFGAGCTGVDPGPTETSKEDVDAGKAETVGAEIRMGAGDLTVEGGGTKLLAGTFRYSEKIGRPTVRYSLAEARGRLTVESPEESKSIGRMTNEWKLQMGSGLPLELKVTVGAGKAVLDMSKLPLRSLELDMGAGELALNLTGKYSKDVTVQVNSGVGEARIRLPRDMGVSVDAKAGIGGVNAKGLIQRAGKYYNEAFAEGKPAIRMDVRGGVGEVTLSVEE